MKELEKKIFDYLKAHEEDIIADIETLAKAESPTADKAACDACARVLAGLYKDRIGVTTELVPSEKSGDNLVSVYTTTPSIPSAPCRCAATATCSTAPAYAT